MSYRAVNWAYELPLKGSMKPVLVALADMADEANSCFPGQGRIAEMTGLSSRTVRTALVKLEELGLLSRSRRFDQFGHRTSDRYVLSVGESLPEESASGEIDQRRKTSSLPEKNVTPTGSSRQVTIREPSEEPSVLSPDANAPSKTDLLFDEIWDMWPPKQRGTRKKSGSSFRTALKAVGGVRQADLIMIPAKTHTDVWRNWPASEQQFIPQMTTWLNQERWTLEKPEQRSSSKPANPARSIPKSEEWMYR